jgi:hypothetical protein
MLVLVVMMRGFRKLEEMVWGLYTMSLAIRVTVRSIEEFIEVEVESFNDHPETLVVPLVLRVFSEVSHPIPMVGSLHLQGGRHTVASH